MKVIDRRSEAFFNVLGDYRSLYTEYAPLLIKSVTPGEPGAYGLQFAFTSNMSGLRQIEAADREGNFKPLRDNVLFVSLDEKGVEPQEKTFRVRPVFSPPRAESVYTIRVHCTTRTAFEKMGGKRNKDIIKVTCEPQLNFGSTTPESWKTFRPTEAEIAFAQKQWGALLRGVTSDYAKAQILTKALIRELQGCGGLPSASIYGLKTFEKYAAITSGKSKYACAQYSEIFSKACNCFGVINRWGFNHDNLQNDDMLIEFGSSHLVAEIFDRELNQWIFLDGSAKVLGAYLGEVGPLNLHEFFLFINQPQRRNHLKVMYYDLDKDREQLMPVDQCPSPFLSYRGWNKGFHTEYRGAK